MKRIFNKTTCWNIFDHTSNSEKYWNLQRAGHHKSARRAAILLTIRFPFRMLPVIRDCYRC